MSAPLRVLVTGSAGFIGSAVAIRLLERGDEVIGLDDHNPYYDPALKEARARRNQAFAGYTHHRCSITDRPALEAVFARHRPRRVVHLAAQAGVRYAAENPHAYADSNLVGFLNVLECCRAHQVEHLVYASTSSVYGANTRLPFSVHDHTDHPLSLYAATKKANELMAHCYAHLYDLPVTGLRFFTVYGPWGRPDMALFKFTRAILAGEPIQVYNHGDHSRDFTYIDDIVEGVVRCLDRPARPDPDWDPGRPDPAASAAPYRLYNIGNGKPVPLMDYIHAIERALGKRAEIEYLPLQPGDVPHTHADVTELAEAVGYRPATPVEEGVARFVLWYREYYRV